MTQTHRDGRVERGNQTRRLVLSRTVQTASVEGLEALSLGRIATELKLSKSGVFALFGSKEELQLATVRAAAEAFAGYVVQPVRVLPPGARRAWALCDRWLDYSATRVFDGGCFFYTASAEYGGRDGAVRDAVAAARAEWEAYVERTLVRARDAGEFRDDLDAPQLAFEVVALMESANALSVLHDTDDGLPYARARRGILNRLRAVAVEPGLLPGEPGEPGES